MAVTAETRSTLIGLSVAMLGSAPGADLLNKWVAALDGGMSLEDVANDIAASDTFQTAYPAFLTPREFARDFLDSLMGDEEVSAALVAAAVDIVAGLLNDGMTRGALALNVVAALGQINAQGESHPAHADLGAVAMSLANKIEVATYYTVNLLQSGSNSRVLRDIDSQTGLADVKDGIGDHLDPAPPILLTNLRDNIEGTDGNDLIIAEPDRNGRDTLDSFDAIDGGAGYDTLEIYVTDTTEGHVLETLNGDHADVTNVEKAYLSSRTNIKVDLSGWEGLREVELGRFGGDSDVSVTVDGATVSTARTFGGDSISIHGAGGTVELKAGKATAISVYSGEHTTTVETEGGASLRVEQFPHSVPNAYYVSKTVESVRIDGLQHDWGSDGVRGLSIYVLNPQYDSTVTDDTDIAYYKYLTASGLSKLQSLSSSQDFTNPAVLALVLADVANAPSAGAADSRALAKSHLTPIGLFGGIALDSADKHTALIRSSAIKSISIHNTLADVRVSNVSKDPQDLSVTVENFNGSRLTLTGTGAPENVSVTYAGESSFRIDSATKSYDVSGDGSLSLTSGYNLETVTLSGSGKFLFSQVSSKLATIDAGASTGENTWLIYGPSVTTITGGSGADTVTMAGDYAADGLTADLGAGDDTFISGAGNEKSAIDGGAGRDTLMLTDGATLDADGEPIYRNFEILDVGGSAAAAYDAAKLGVDTVKVSKNTTGTVTLTMTDGMAVNVEKAAAIIVHDLKDRKAGDPRYSGELDVNLMAKGGETDAKGGPGTGAAMLTLFADTEIEVLNVDSGATPGGEAAAGDYKNALTLDLASGVSPAVKPAVKVVRVAGDAQFELKAGPGGAAPRSTRLNCSTPRGTPAA